MKNTQTNNATIQKILGTAAALFGLASGVLYQRHEAVMVYQPNNVANTLGLYALIISIVLWIAFVVVWTAARKK